MKNKVNIIRIVGFIATLIGIAEPIMEKWVDDKKMDEKIEKKVNEALALRDKEEES